MLQRSHPILDLYTLCHMNSGLTLHPQQHHHPFLTHPWNNSLAKLPAPLRNSHNSPAAWPQHPCPAGLFSSLVLLPCGISEDVCLCAVLGNVSMDASGMLLLPTGKGLSLLRYFLKIVWVASLTPFLLSDKSYILFRTGRYFFKKHLCLEDSFYSCQVAVGHIYSVPSSKTTNCCQHFGLDGLLWLRCILPFFLRIHLLIFSSSILVFQYVEINFQIKVISVPAKAFQGNLKTPGNFWRFSSKTFLHFYQISLLCNVFTGFACDQILLIWFSSSGLKILDLKSMSSMYKSNSQKNSTLPSNLNSCKNWKWFYTPTVPLNILSSPCILDRTRFEANIWKQCGDPGDFKIPFLN